MLPSPSCLPQAICAHTQLVFSFLRPPSVWQPTTIDTIRLNGSFRWKTVHVLALTIVQIGTSVDWFVNRADSVMS
jgi:hypothetical protein